MEALELMRKHSLKEYLKDSWLVIAKCLMALEKRQQAAYYIILGSILTLKQESFEKFYNLIDELMTSQRKDTLEGEEVRLTVDGSTDTTPNESITKFIVKLEHATNVETWRSVVIGILEEQNKPAVVEVPKENEEPIDFMELICKMNSRMDDQRTEMPAAMFAARKS